MEEVRKGFNFVPFTNGQLVALKMIVNISHKVNMVYNLTLLYTNLQKAKVLSVRLYQCPL